MKTRDRLLVLSLILASLVCTDRKASEGDTFLTDQGGIIRGDRMSRALSLVFTGGDFSDGGPIIRSVLKDKGIRAGFFFTGDFYRNSDQAQLIEDLIEDGHYLGPHSDKHLLYCPWEDRNALLVSREEFVADILGNYEVMKTFGIDPLESRFFIPPYEWYNDTIVSWAGELGLVVVNFTPGTGSNSDYTTPSMENYRTSDSIFEGILAYERQDAHGLNGFILLLHVGTHPDRKDKFYDRLEELIESLREKGYEFLRIDQLLAGDAGPG